MRKQIFISAAVLIFLFLGTALVIIYGKGYQIDFQRGRPEIAGTGLLVVTSNPDGAQVLINDHLTTATNNTINLAPGTYKIKIRKEGYFPWTKTIIVQKEVVAKAEAFLLPNAPKLENITDLGVNNPVLDPSGTKIAFAVASQSGRKSDGIYIFNMNGGQILTLQSASNQIVDDTTDLFSTAKLSWSPDGQNILATIPGQTRTTTYLLDANNFNQTPNDITETLTSVIDTWQKDTQEKTNSQIATLNPMLKKIVVDNFTILAWSPDETKILYIASTSATLPFVITPPLIGTNSTPQDRLIEQGKVYIYDMKEDKNYKILDNFSKPMDPSSPSPLVWLPDNKHLLYVHDRKIDIMEYDASNKTTVYAGPFIDNYVFPWPNGSKFVILTNLGNADISPNLYTVDLR